MKKAIKVFFTIAKSVTFILFLFTFSLIIVSFSLSNEKRTNPYCVNKYQNEIVIINDKSIKEYTFNFDCNTLYINALLIDNIDEVALNDILLNIKEQVINYDCFIHLTLTSNDKTYYASISKEDKKIYLLGKGTNIA